MTQFAFEPGCAQPATVLKTYHDGPSARWAEMCALMKAVYNHPDPVLVRSVPQVLRSWKEGERFVVCEAFVEGASLQRRAERHSLNWRGEFVRHLAAVTDWTAAFHRVSVVGHYVFEADRVQEILQDLKAYVPEGTFEVAARTTRVPAVIRHRDLRPANILQTREGLRIIDWDRFAMRGLPLLDLMEFIIRYVHAHCMWQVKGMHLAPAVFRRYLDLIYCCKSALSRAIRHALNRYAQALGMDTQQQQLLLACWVYYMFYPTAGKTFCVFEGP